MFQIVDEIEVTWPVKVQVPTDGGAHQEQVFTARFKIIDTDEEEQAVERGRRSNRALINKALVGWGDDVAGPDGKPLKFSEDARAALIKIPYVATALVLAYYEAAAGAPAKN